MKTRAALISLFAITGIMAFGQLPTLELTFTAENNGTYVQLGSIKVMNQTRGVDTVLYWPDTVLSIYEVGIPENPGTSGVFQVFQNYPNPVADKTTIAFYVPEKDQVSLIVTDMLGKVIIKSDRMLDKGTHSFRFTPGRANLYFFTAQWKGNSSSIKILHVPVSSNPTPKLDYVSSERATPRLKVMEDIQDFTYALGDTLLLIGYASTLESGMLDSPEESQTYTFQFATNIPCPGTPTVEYGGQVYNTIQIFSQCWLKENLNVGTMIQGYVEMSDNGILEKYCYNNEPDSCTKYGGLYKWDEMMQYTTQEGAQGICPPGWYIPTNEEWKVLEGAVDSQYGIGDPEWDLMEIRGLDAGTNLKATSGWIDGGNGTDLFGFSALPAGKHYSLGSYDAVGMNSYLFSSTMYFSNVWDRIFGYLYPEVYLSYTDGSYTSSARCILGTDSTGFSPEGLVAHWLFNGDADDATGNGNDGTPMAGHPWFGGGAPPQLTADRFGNANYCYHFDQGCNIEVPYKTSLNPNTMTISLWINMEEQPNNDYIIAMNRWNGWKLNIQDQNFLFYTVKALNNGDTIYYDRDSNPQAIAADTWTHVAITYTDGFINFYVNGILVQDWDNIPGTAIKVDNINLTIGSDLPTGVYTTDDEDFYFYVGWGGYFKGDMDDVRLYNILLTPAEVDSIYSYEKDHVVEE